MKYTSYSYLIIVNFEISREELEHLIKVSSIHYDRKCQDASKQGGFIYGWKNRLEFNRTDSVEVNATICELDTVTKILEMEHLITSSISLQKAFNELAQNACKESEKKNQS